MPLNNYVSLFTSGWDIPDKDMDERMILEENRVEFLQKIGGVLSDFEFKVTVMYVDGMSAAEICRHTGKDGKSVDNALQRSKKKLQKLLAVQG